MLKLRELRKQCGMTMKELGLALGLAESTISQYERGNRQPDFETLLKLGEFFGVSVDYILGNEKTPTETGERTITEDDIKAAFFEGADDLTKEDIDLLWADAKDYMNYKLQQRRSNK